MGKFYELFEMDAHVGAKELGLQYMKVLKLCWLFIYVIILVLFDEKERILPLLKI